MKRTVYAKNNCRVCKGKMLQRVFTFGPTPLANEFLKKPQLDLSEDFYPLDVNFCRTCSFLQLTHVVDPKLLFGNYVYVSSTSPVFIKHFQKFAGRVERSYGFSKDSLVVDIGSNDGILLKPFKEQGMKVLGIEPAKHIATIARKDGIPTMAEYFTTAIAKKVVKEYGNAKVVTATNVFAHIDDLDEVINGLDILMDKDGIFIVEAPYLVDFLQKRYFDLVYHEHLSYWSVRTLATIFERFSLNVIDVQKVPVHGGSIRVFISRKGAYKIQPSVKKFLALEKKMKLSDSKIYASYALKVQQNKINLLTMLAALKAKGKKIVGYGAPAKGNTLLNYFSIGSETLDYIIDDSPLKQGLFSPGKHIPVVASTELKKKKPDYILILAWNFAEPIMQKLQPYKNEGVKFIVPVPKPTIF